MPNYIIFIIVLLLVKPGYGFVSEPSDLVSSSSSGKGTAGGCVSLGTAAPCCWRETRVYSN